MDGWHEDRVPPRRAGLLAQGFAGLRFLAFGVAVFGGLPVLLLIRLVEMPLNGAARPWSPHVTQTVCSVSLILLGLRLTMRGRPMEQRGALVANHASWLDIFVLNACDRVYFVSKAEVARWPGIGWLARATGTLFIARDPAEAKVQQGQFEARLRAGHRLLFFPEGTSTDSLRILPFKTTLFAAFFTHGMEEIMHIQPVTVRYHAPEGEDARFYGWWGDMDFAGHLWRLLATLKRGRVEVTFHAPVAVEDFAGRKPLAAHLEKLVRSKF